MFLVYSGILFSNLRHDDEDEQNEPDDEVDPEQPTQKCEVGGYHGTEMRFYLLNTQFPWDQQVRCIRRFTLQLLPFL